MRKDSRLSRMLHLLLHLSKFDKPATSEAIAGMLGTNPVVIRRTLAGLREHGYVASEKGHGGGWVLARPLEEITLLDIHRALGTPETFAIGNAQDNPTCAIERSVNAALGEAFLSPCARRRSRERAAEHALRRAQPGRRGSGRG